jgi:Concanavalin A-like lectin/glucanases superfamily
MNPKSSSTNARPETIRGISVPGLWGYVTPQSVAPGGRLEVHASAEAGFALRVVRLGRRAILDPDADHVADREDAEVLYRSVSRDARPQTVAPGSYVYADGPRLRERPLTVGLWFRPWRLPVTDTVSFTWAGLISDLDFPDRCHFALLLDFTGRVGIYAGDGGAYDQRRLLWAGGSLGDRLGEWHHLVGVIGEDVRLFLDGALVGSMPNGAPAPGDGRARLRLGACAQRGVVDNLLDADIAAPFAGRFEAGEAVAKRLFDDRGLSDLPELLPPGLLSHWPLDEEKGSRVRDAAGELSGTIVNHGTWQIGGPACSAEAGQPGYDPAADAGRGHALRLCVDDLVDCGWPCVEAVTVPPEAESGMYAVELTLQGRPESEALSIPFVVVRTKPRRARSVALLVPTFTWAAYGRVPLDEVRVPGLTSSFYTTHANGRLFFHVGLNMPQPRVGPYVLPTHRPAHSLHAHVVRPERFAEAWLAAEGYRYELVTDWELHHDPGFLAEFAALLVVGHSEYWSDEMRGGVLDYLEGGGRVLCLSGNTLYWRVSLDRERMTVECRKTMLEDESHENPSWLRPAEWRERWHTDGRPGGTWSLVGAPGAEVLGLDSWAVSDMGNPAGYAPYRILRPDHFLLEGVELDRDGTIGGRCLNGAAASGFETDALPSPQPGLAEGRPPVLLGQAEGIQNVFLLDEPTADHGRDASLGADLIYWDRPGGGEVVNAGSIAFSGALPVDPGASALVRNALAHFEVARRDAARRD